MCFRAVRTKAALGKGRELKPKWKTLSRVLENLGFMDSSALWNKRYSVSQRDRKALTLGYCGLSFLLQISQKFWLTHKTTESPLALMASHRHPKTPKEGCRGQRLRKDHAL